MKKSKDSLEDLPLFRASNKEDNELAEGVLKEQKQKEEALIAEVNAGVFSVSDFLDFTNSRLKEAEYRVKGEVGQLQERSSYVFFSLKDKEDESVLRCFAWQRTLKFCGVQLKEGTEVIVSGYSEVYKRTGSLSFQVKTVELVGEGVLKKAFEELKEKLQKEGLFAEEVKKPLPFYPKTIGLITSRHGEAINDFNANLGSFGFKIKFIDCRVEGQRAVFDLIAALKSFGRSKNRPDVLALVRGGGSWESLQAFNNEELAREIHRSSIPIISGVGHEGDVTIADLAADFRASTPTGAAKRIGEEWRKAREELNNRERDIFSGFPRFLENQRLVLERSSSQILLGFGVIPELLRKWEVGIKNGFSRIEFSLEKERGFLEETKEGIRRDFLRGFLANRSLIDSWEKTIVAGDPENQLRLGYSLAYQNGNLLKSAKMVVPAKELEIKFSDGKIVAMP
jgi:exodeoxyribonuclease VII large subunit